jgi:hypothetical protein
MLGRAIHAWIEQEIIGGPARSTPREVAERHQLAEDDAGRLCYLAERLRLDLPAGAQAEVALGLWPDGSVRRALGGAGQYIDEGQLLSGTLDAMWTEGDTLWVADWKTGDAEHVAPARRNWQVRAGAVLASRWTGARRVQPAVCFLNAADAAEAARRGDPYRGRWDLGDLLDGPALDALYAELYDALTALPMGGLVTGPQCDWCASRHACPALASAAVSLARADGLDVPEGGTLTPEAATRLVDSLAAIRRAADAAEVALRAYAQAHGPVPCADGRAWGPAQEMSTGYRGELVEAVLAARMSPEALDAYRRRATRWSTELLRDAAGPARGAWPALRRDLEAAGAVEERPREVWRRRWPGDG